MALWIKGCPRCGGDLYSDRDIMGYYRQCMQCGFTYYENRRRPSRPVSDPDVQEAEPPQTLDDVPREMTEAA